MQSVIGRLNDSLRMKSLEQANTARLDGSTRDQDTDNEQQDQTTDYMHIMQEKNNAIHALELELADAHIKLAEQEHTGDGRLASLERELQDVKMRNARLTEENDSFQMLLSERTLKGDFLTHDNDTKVMSSLAEELESIGEGDEVSIEAYKKLESELKNIKEEKKALTLYIDKIIGRLLQHEGFEHIITGKDDEESAPPAPPPKAATAAKPLPATPSPAATSPPQQAIDAQPAQMGFLQRARSVVSRAAGPKPRPMSYMPPAQPTANENPQTAPSIPINKNQAQGHRRARSDQAQPDMGAAVVVQQMNRGSPLRTASGSPISPGINSLQRAQTSYFAPTTNSTSTGSARAPSQSRNSGHRSSNNSIVSEDSLGRDSLDAGSLPPSNVGHREPSGGAIPGAVMKQSQLRPLRLVQEQHAADEEMSRKAKRGSWMGWFNQGSVESQQM